MKDYGRYSYWLETCGDDLTPRPALEDSISVDVAILGGGFTGLWTAYYLLQRDPSLKVAVLEKEICGFGASGRNGGWCTAAYPLGIRPLAARFGREVARQVQFAMYDTVDEVGRVAQAEGLNIDYAKGGSLSVARGPQHLPALKERLRTYEEFGLADQIHYLDERETSERVRIAGALASLYSPNTAVVHPGKLVRGLSHTVERYGGVIYERTEVTGFTTGPRPELITNSGNARAKTIVLAGEGYLSQVPGMRRKVMPAYSQVTATEPLSADQWREIGWAARECISAPRFAVDYLSKTADGRILFGGRGSPYRFGSSIKDEYDYYGPTARTLHDLVRAWFPMLHHVRFTHDWGGPLGWSRNYAPTIAYDPKERIAKAHGYTGVGVATANLAGRILADKITGHDSDVSQLPIVNLPTRKWEPEPLRFLGVRYVQRSFRRLDRKADSTGIPPNGKSLAERLTRH